MHQADRFVLGLALERSWAAKDAEALRSLLDGAAVRLEHPFDDAADGSVAAVADLLAGDVAIDATARHVAGATTTWRVRGHHDDGAVRPGQVAVTLDRDRVTALRLGA
ncbi:MAG TPA: hypothetical protein VGH76_04700 [Actinomycetospora sp.]|uniref:hypothetical protein n=1 Tax=Actinomycetospora sp. TaxID=1872135 RepID=UPI002F4245D0